MFRSGEIRDGEFDGEEVVPPQEDSGRRDTFTIDLDQFGVQSLVRHAYFEQEQHPFYYGRVRGIQKLPLQIVN